MRQGMGFFIAVILARLLMPEDFGTIALLSLSLGFAGLFVNAGFSAALIQKQDTTHIEETTVFWFNVAAGLVIMVLLFVIAPWIAEFFNLSILTPLTMLMACNVFVSALGSIHGTLMTKRLDFKTPMKIGVISTLVSGGVGVYMAWADYGVWALAGQALVSNLVGTVLLWHYSNWRPLFAFSRDSFKRLFGFSGWMFGSAMLDTLYQQGYSLLIGKFYGTRDLGLYNRADSTQQFPASILTGMLARVALPLFSSVNKEKERLRSGVRMSVRSMMLIMVPSMMGLAVLAETLISVVFGERWLPAAPILQVLCAVGMLYPLQVINLNALQAQGHANLFFRLEVVKKSSGILLLIIGSFFGLMGIAWSRVIQSIIALMINGHYTRKFLGYSMREQIMDCLPSFVLSVVMAASVAMAETQIQFGGIVDLILLILLGAAIYVSSNVLLGISAFRETAAFVRGQV